MTPKIICLIVNRRKFPILQALNLRQFVAIIKVEK
jgi:hypothetical protein